MLLQCCCTNAVAAAVAMPAPACLCLCCHCFSICCCKATIIVGGIITYPDVASERFIADGGAAAGTVATGAEATK